MGGCMITKVGKSVEELLPIMKKQILEAARIGLWADSALIIMNPYNEAVHIFKVKYAPLGTELTFHEVEDGRSFHVGIAGRYGPHPEPGQLVATVHVHT